MVEVGVEDMSKVILLEDPACREMKLKQIQMNECIFKACEAVSTVRVQVDKLSEKVMPFIIITLETTPKLSYIKCR